VVASEVKALASQTATATEEIGARITDMQVAADAPVKMVGDIRATIDPISEISTSTSISTSIEAQSAATREIASNIQLAAPRSGAVMENNDQVSDGAELTDVAAARLLKSALSLLEESRRLKSEVESFLGELRASCNRLAVLREHVRLSDPRSNERAMIRKERILESRKHRARDFIVNGIQRRGDFVGRRRSTYKPLWKNGANVSAPAADVGDWRPKVEFG
jgi:hypothetical protein